MPKVVNCRNYPANDSRVLYCARAWAGWTASPLGNPYHIRHRWNPDERRQVIDKYRLYLWQQITAGNKEVIAAIRSIKEDSLLGCWCYPQPCHCDVIIEVWSILNAHTNT